MTLTSAPSLSLRHGSQHWYTLFICVVRVAQLDRALPSEGRGRWRLNGVPAHPREIEPICIPPYPCLRLVQGFNELP